MDIVANLNKVKHEIPDHVQLVAVSKTKPADMVQALYEAGHLDFGENRVQDLIGKYEALPKEIRWHLIGHLQTNKVKYIARFVHLVHGVDSMKLLAAIDKEGRKNNRKINCLLQMNISKEETKFGFSEDELMQMLHSEDFNSMSFANIQGVMGMATFTDDSETVRKEFQNLKRIFDELKKGHFESKTDFSIVSMGMSADFKVAIEEGSNMIRVGSSIFGPRILQK
ncbi:YggS family pyridoxal phosphate-dependent enzyme [Bacteroidota bacterium]